MVWIASLCLALSAAVAAGLGAPGSASAETAWLASVQERRSAWQPPMRLGARAETWSSDEAGQSPKRAASQCRRWRAMAHQLGESYAGYALRTSVIRRTCDSPLAERRDEAWDFPWAGLAQGRLLPQRPHREFGDWHVRCGGGAWRHRCAALMAAADASAGQILPARPKVVVHFVIDMIAGRESVLWRMFVERDPATTVASATAVVPARSDTRSIRYTVGGREHVERFSTCAPTGCIMEAGLARGSEIATALWDGKAMAIEVDTDAGAPMQLTLSALGFREALRELVRLRREEIRTAGRR